MASEFADFFMDKIQKIRDKLDVQPMYQPTSVNICQLNNFEEMSEDEVRKGINSVATKSCDIDPSYASILQESVNSKPEETGTPETLGEVLPRSERRPYISLQICR